MVIDEKSRQAAPARRRWRGFAIAAVTALLIGGGYATANAGVDPAGRTTAAQARPPRGLTGVPAVVGAANAFLATLSDDQKAEVLLDFSEANATAWSNLPCGGTCRPGIQFGSLTAEQLAAAKAVLQAAQGTGGGTGFDQAMQILQADDVLAGAGDSAPSATASAAPTASSDPTASTDPTATVDPSATATATPTDTPTDIPSGTPPSGGTGGPAGGGYGSGIYFLAFLGTPSTTGTWQLHFGGHHLAVNLTYRAGKVAGASPYFVGVEPTSFTTDDGDTLQPLKIMRDGMLKLTTSLTAAQQATAKLTESFSDVLIGPGEDGQFPATKQGISVRRLSPAQKRLVLAAIHPWVAVVDDATAAQLMRTYERELDQTFVAYSGGLNLDTHGDYVRIDGPGVWIEFICQDGVVYRDQIHFHTVYRDHTRDYGGEFTF